MRIHTDNLILLHICGAVSGIDGVTVHVTSEHGSRSHRKAFEVALRGHGARHTRRPNSGITGAVNNEYAATYDDWGYFLAALYATDPDMKAGWYKNANDFNRQTQNKYT